MLTFVQLISDYLHNYYEISNQENNYSSCCKKLNLVMTEHICESLSSIAINGCKYKSQNCIFQR